jgi:peroxiredoxin Q/BCP
MRENASVMLTAGDPLPDFNLADDRGATWTPAELAGRRTVLYFYPKDDTPGCTRQACALRDAWDALLAVGALVLGVSPDDAASHVAFREKFNLPFLLLADTDRALATAFGVLEGARLVRSTFLIGPSGVIEHAWPNVSPDEHLALVLDALAG